MFYLFDDFQILFTVPHDCVDSYLQGEGGQKWEFIYKKSVYLFLHV